MILWKGNDIMKKLHSLRQLREELHLKPLKPREEKEILCRKCGHPLKKVAENTYICEYEDEKGKRCGNIYMQKSKHTF